MKGALLALLGVAAASASTCVELTIEDYGKVDIELTDDATPITVANFLSYVDDKGEIMAEFINQVGATRDNRAQRAILI